jgi:organic radical activating enzyme
LEAFLQQDEQSPANKNTKCILPWIHQYGDLSGQYGLCCFTLNHDSNLFGKGLSPLEAFNSDPIRSARLEMLAGKQPKACKVCYDWEEEGIESHRQRMNQRFQNYSKLYNTTLEDGTITTPPIYLDFRFGNLCNFSCRMCGSYASSSWSKEEKYHGTLKQNAPNSYDFWTDNDNFWTDIDKIKTYIRELYFAGGEPFVQEGHYKMLQFLVDNNCSKNIDLSYNTNLSYNGNFKGYDIEKLWSSFKSVDLWPSIEGFDEKAEYGRKGLDIVLFKKNAERFSKYIKTYSLVSNVYSITSNLELIKWIKTTNKSFNITNLVNPDYLSTTILSKDIKKQVLQTYREELYNIPNLSEYETKSILSSLRYMNSKDDSHLQDKFKKINTRSDLYRNESFEVTFSELAEWYKNI